MDMAEFDMGRELSASITSTFDARLVVDIMSISEAVVRIDDDVGAPEACSTALVERVSLGNGVAGDQVSRMASLMRKGGRMAFVLRRSAMGMQVLESLGYERCERLSPGSAELVQEWKACLTRAVPDAKAGLVFCHDLEPAFVFDISPD